MQHLNELTDTVTAQSRTAYSDLQRVSIFQHMHVINNTFHLCFTVIYCKNERKIAKGKRAGYRRLYLCDRFFEQKMADVVGCTTPEGEICEVNTYFVYLI